MKSVELDWSYLLKDTLWPSVTAAVAIAVLTTSHWFVNVQQERYSQFSNNQSAMNEDYDALLYRKRLVNRYYRRYEYFQMQGFVGSESRLEWIESIRIIANELGLPHVNYSLQPQREVIAPVGQIGGDSDISISQSTFEFEIGLLHELDLLRFVNRLQAKSPGLIKVDRCSLTRQSAAAEISSTDANIVANCSIVMFSVITADVADNAATI